MACRFSNIDDDCWEFCTLLLFSLFAITQGMWVYFCHNQRLYKWEKWFYYINTCINKTLYVLTEKLCVLHSHALGVYFYSSALMWLKTTASQILSVFTCWMSRSCLCAFCVFIQLWRFVKLPEEGSPATHRGSSSQAVLHLPLLLLSANQRLRCPFRLIGLLLTYRALGADPI